MTQTATTRPARNGVDVPSLFATLDVVKAQRELANFQFRATNKWQSGTHSKTEINGYFGAGGEQVREQAFVLDGDHPAVLVGGDNGATPVEVLLHALAGCLTAGMANIASARGIDLESIESTVEGNIDMQGLLGMNDEVRNGYQDIRISYKVKGDASDEDLARLLEQSKARSAVYDVLTNGVPVAIEMEKASN